MERWNEVDRYLEERIVAAEPALERSLAANAAAGLPRIDVSAVQGKFLRLLARIRGARSVLEIGTLGGYSTIWLAGKPLKPRASHPSTWRSSMRTK